MSKVEKLSNGFTLKQQNDWMRACRFAAAYVLKMFHKPWTDDSVSDGYMAARNGYLAGYKAAERAAQRR